MKAHFTQFLSSLPSLRSIALTTAMLAGIANGEEAWNWNVKQIDGREFVSVGTIQEFYHFDRFSREGGAISVENRKVALKLVIGSTLANFNGIRVHLADPVVEMDDAAYLSRRDLSGLLDPILRPNAILNAGDFQTVILDPAHGSKNPGIKNDFGTEAAFAMEVATRAKEEFEKKGYRVVMTREGDGDPTDEQRRDLANSVEESAIFIHLSFGSGPEESRGVETRTISPLDGESIENAHGPASVALATSTHGSLIRKLGKNTEDGGLGRGELSVLSGIRHPSIAVVLGYMTNPYEARLVNDDRYQTAIARAICDGVSKFRDATSQSKPLTASEEDPAGAE